MREQLGGETNRGRIFRELIRRLRIRREESAFSPQADQKVLKLKPEILSIVRENQETGSRIYILVNVSGERQEISCPEIKGKDLLRDRDAQGGLTMEPWDCAWILANC